MKKRVDVKAKEREIHVAPVAVSKEKSEKSRSLFIDIRKQHEKNDTKIKVECDRMIHWHIIQGTANIDLVKDKCENSVTR